MSESLQIVRDGWAAFNRADYEACLALIDPSIEWWPSEDELIVELRFWGRGLQSGAPVEIHETHVVRLRDGKITEVREYREMDQALAALGRGAE